MKLLRSLPLVLALWSPPTLAGVPEDVRTTYLGFVEAQNARDPDRIRSFFTDAPDFLWVSDGKAYWGPDAVIARMSNFQKAAVWRVEPDVQNARVIELDDGTVLYHLDLILVIGPETTPSRLPFLVTIALVRGGDDWKIAALMTTSSKP